MFQVSPIIGIMVATGVLFVGLADRSCNENQSKTRGKNNPQMEITQVMEGVWGGEHIIMEVTSKSAVITCDCAVGTIDEPMKLDKNGRFAVRGTFTPQRGGGSVRSDQVPDRHPAHYEGRIEGKSMTLTLKLPKTSETVDTFNLTYGETPELKRCM